MRQHVPIVASSSSSPSSSSSLVWSSSSPASTNSGTSASVAGHQSKPKNAAVTSSATPLATKALPPVSSSVPVAVSGDNGGGTTNKHEAPSEFEDFHWRDELRKEPAFFLVLLFVSWEEGMQGLSDLAVAYWYKDDLKVTPGVLQTIQGLLLLPWIMKPLWGIITDSYPLFGYRRKTYLGLACLVSGVCWLAMAMYVTTLDHSIIVLLIKQCSKAFVSVIARGLIVEHCRGGSQRYAAWLQSMFYGVSAFASLTAAYFGGYLLEYTSKANLMAFSAIFPLSVTLLSIILPEIPHTRTASVPVQLKKLYRAVMSSDANTPSGDVFPLWQPMLFMVLWRSAPSAGAPMFYFFTNDLGFQPEFMGRLKLFGALFSFFGMLVYNRWLVDVSYRVVLFWGSLLHALLIGSQAIVCLHLNRSWGIPDSLFVTGDEAVGDALSVVSFFPILVLAARVCPKGVESSMYALLMAFINIGKIFGKEWGSLLTIYLGITDTHFDNLWLLVIICSVCSLLPLILLPVLVPDAYIPPIDRGGDEVGDVDDEHQTLDESMLLSQTQSNAAQAAALREARRQRRYHERQVRTGAIDADAIVQRGDARAAFDKMGRHYTREPVWEWNPSVVTGRMSSSSASAASTTHGVIGTSLLSEHRWNSLADTQTTSQQQRSLPSSSDMHDRSGGNNGSDGKLSGIVSRLLAAVKPSSLSSPPPRNDLFIEA